MKPSIGRIVLFCPSHLTSGGMPVPCAAIVTSVLADSVFIRYFEPNGSEGGARQTNIEPSSIPSHGRWMWPPRV